jgi:hypothetical protein
MIHRMSEHGHYFVEQNLEVLRDVVDKASTATDTSISELDERVTTLEAEIAAPPAGPKVIRGNIVLPSGAAFVLVTHNYGIDTNYQVAVVPTGGDCEFRWYASNKNINDFRINLAGTATANHNFDWILIA